MRTKLRSRLSLLFLSFALVLALPAMAFADQIANNVDATVDATAEVMPLQVGGANGSTQLSVIPTDGGSKSGCDLTGSNTVTAAVSSSNTAVATVSPSSVTFGSCGTTQTLTVTPKAQGTTTISLNQTGTTLANTTFDMAPATFTVNVSAAPPSNTPPQVTVNGVTHGADYEKGSVPPAACQVTDAEDSNESATPVKDSVNLNSFGLGQQTVTCSYTDAGGLEASSSKTYNIVDTTKPVIAAHADVTKEATGANGALVNYTNPTANDAVYGSVNVDCAPASGSQFALGSTTVTCNATDGSGNAAVATTFNVIVEDTTAPTNIQFVGGPAAGGSYDYGDVPAAPTCTADDSGSGLNPAGCVVTGYGNAVGGHTLTATATDKAGNKTTATRTYTVNKATAQVNLSNLNQVYDGSAKTVGTSTSNPAGLNVDVTYDGDAQAPTNAGSYAVVATVNNANYQGNANGTLSIARADQAISFGALANKTYGDANFNVSASGGASGNPVTFKAVGNCELVGNTVHLTGAGSCTITASQAGNANYNAATDVSRSFAIAKAQASINLSGLSKTYTGQPQAATVTTTPVDLSGVNVTYDGSEQAPTNAGSYNVVASLTNPNYEARNATGTLVIAKAKADVTLSDLTQTYDGTVKAASASTTPSGLNVDFAYSQNGSPATPKNAGSYAVVATVKNANYEGSANGTLVIEKAKASINLSDLSKTYTGQAQGATVTTTPDVPNAQLTVTYDGSEQTPVNAGSYRVVASLNDANYQAQDATGTLVIAKAEATINLGGLSKTYTGQAQGATVTTTPADLGGVSVTYDGIAQAPTNAGSYRVVASLTNPNYEAQNATGTLVIAKAPAQVNLSDLTQTYNGSPRAATVATVPANLNVDVTYDGNAQAPTNAGSYAVVATVKNANYEGSANGTLVIDKASQAITFAPLAAKIVGANFTVNATGGASGNAVTFAAAGSCTVSGNTVQITGVGTCTITASQAGNSNYNAAPNVQQSFSATYNFTGFASPVDNNNVLNTAKAGQAIPLKWRLTDASGNPVTNLSSVKVTATSLNCALGTTTDLLEEYAAGSSGLQNLGDGYYQFNWKSPTTYATSCKTLNVDMGEGAAVTHTALFKFTK